MGSRERKPQSLNIEALRLPQQRKRSVRYDYGHASAEFISNPKDYYKRIYYEALDLIIMSITDHFDQPGYAPYSILEQLLLKPVI